jgi:hypothetical protein
MLVLNCQVKAQLVVYEPMGFSAAVQEYADFNRSKEELNGWGILITLNRDRRQMEKMESRFKYHFPEFEPFVFWRFEDPYYKLIVGAFPNRLYSLPVLEAIRQKFPAAFEIKHSFPPKEIMDFRRASYKYILQDNIND